MASYAILRIEKRKLGAVKRICDHHERLKEEYKSNPDIDPSRTHLNYHLKKPSDVYRPLILKRIDEAGAKRRSNSIVLQDCFATASPEWMNALDYTKQQEFFGHVYDYFIEKFGEGNIISAVVHMYEANPHMHICFVPLTKDNRLSSKEIIGGPRGLAKHQDDFYAHMAEKFPDLQRGIPAKITHRKHIPTSVYKNAALLYEHYEEIVGAINDIGMLNHSKKKDEAIALIGRYAPELANMKSQLRMTDKYVDDLEVGLRNMRASRDEKYDIIYDQEQEISQLKNQVADLNAQQRKLQREIDRIQPEILEELRKVERKRRREERDAR